MYLNAASLGDFGVVRQSLDNAKREGSNFNVDCVDYMGRSALHLAVDTEKMDIVDILLDELSPEAVEEALLHAINKGLVKLAKVHTPMYYTSLNQQPKNLCNFNFFINRRFSENLKFSADVF